MSDYERFRDENDSLKNINETYKIDNKGLKIVLANKNATIEELIQKIDLLSKKDVDISNINDLIQAQKEEINLIKSDFVCDKCDYKAANLKSFLTHLTKKHQPGEFRNILCKNCDFRCQNDSEMKLHNTEMHKEKIIFS